MDFLKRQQYYVSDFLNFCQKCTDDLNKLEGKSKKLDDFRKKSLQQNQNPNYIQNQNQLINQKEFLKTQATNQISNHTPNNNVKSGQIPNQNRNFQRNPIFYDHQKMSKSELQSQIREIDQHLNSPLDVKKDQEPTKNRPRNQSKVDLAKKLAQVSKEAFDQWNQDKQLKAKEDQDNEFNYRYRHMSC